MYKIATLLLFINVFQINWAQDKEQHENNFDFTSCTNDGVRLNYITQQASKLFDSNEFTGIKDLSDQMKNHNNIVVDYLSEKSKKGKKHINIGELKEGVLIIAKLFLCDKCPNYHVGTASGFVLTEDGICATNQHVFRSFKDDPVTYLSVYAIDHKGNVYPVQEVLAADESHDLAIFKVKTDTQLTPCVLGENAQVGDDIQLLSHPDKMFYTYTKGYVTRLYEHPKQKTARQSITAEFAKGSSGAPLFNTKGEVVGVVSATRTITYRKDSGVQMVVREIIPVNSLKLMCSSNTSNRDNKLEAVKGYRPL